MLESQVEGKLEEALKIRLRLNGHIDWPGGDVYEYISSRLQVNGMAGAFRTPRHIIKMMVAMMSPKPDDVICDPACGTAGFLVEAGKFLRENYKEEIRNHLSLPQR